ncbi:MAG: glycoside hydrolase family 16 protein [Spirochaetales bacterium]|nr:glycoside hydrolase family 16 protein [Spirochaetales bacterium]
MKKNVSLFILTLLLLFSCDTGVDTKGDDFIDSEPLPNYKATIGVSQDSGNAVVDLLDSSSSGEYEKLTALKAAAYSDTHRFAGWYDSISGGNFVSGRNAYTFYLMEETNLYALFIDAPTYPASNVDSYTPGDGWNISWRDEFSNGNFDLNEFDGGDTWDREVMSYPPNAEWQVYTGEAETAVEEDGYMIINVTRINNYNRQGSYKSARVISNPGGYKGDSGSKGFTFKYGKIAARIQLPYGKGMWPAFWMLGDSIDETGGNVGWPSCGEIDILESGFEISDDYNFGHADIGGTIHYDTSVDNTQEAWKYIQGKTKLNSGIYADEFHVFELEWSETTLTWSIDGVPYHTQDISGPEFSEFHENFYMIFNVAVGGNLTFTPDDTTKFPTYMYVDWVRYYEK